MGRTQLTPQRLSETKRINIGKIIIFCEGKTEKYYFDYFEKDSIIRTFRQDKKGTIKLKSYKEYKNGKITIEYN